VIGKADGNLFQYDQRFVEKKCVPPASGLFGDGRPVSGIVFVSSSSYSR